MIKLCFYLVQGARISLLELCSCSGYKFLGANLALASKHVVCPEAGRGFHQKFSGLFNVENLSQCS